VWGFRDREGVKGSGSDGGWIHSVYGTELWSVPRAVDHGGEGGWGGGRVIRGGEGG
jgi:hypothetical protein